MTTLELGQLIFEIDQRYQVIIDRVAATGGPGDLYYVNFQHVLNDLRALAVHQLNASIFEQVVFGVVRQYLQNPNREQAREALTKLLELYDINAKGG